MHYHSDLEQLLSAIGIAEPNYHYHPIPYQQETYYECIIELPELFLQESGIAETPSEAKHQAMNKTLQKLKELKQRSIDRMIN